MNAQRIAIIGSSGAGKSRPDLAPDCLEQIDWEFIEWVWNFRDDERPMVLKNLAEHASDKQPFVLRSPHDVEQFVSACRARDTRPGKVVIPNR